MTRLLLLWIAFASAGSRPAWQDLAFAIFPDPDVSSDTATICRVRVVNNGSSTWSGRQIRFEAQALEGDSVAERARGRFGLSLGPHQTLETVIGFSGKYTRFAVRPLPSFSDRAGERQREANRRPGKRREKRHRG
jgi:hypothetical protein